MNPVQILTLSLFLTAGATAQVKSGAEGAEKPKPTSNPPAATQDTPKQDKPKQDKPKQDKPPQPFDGARLLQKSLDSAKREEAFLRQVKQSGGLLNRFLNNRKLANEMTSTFVPDATGPMPAKARRARLLGDGERAKLGDAVLFTVQSVPVTKQEFDAAVAYIKSYPRPGSETPVETLAIETLIEQKAGQGLFPKSAAAARQVIDSVAESIGKGEKFAALAKKYSEDGKTKANGGKCEPMKRSTMDKNYAMTAFNLGVGQVSDVVATSEGYEIIRLLGKKKGDEPRADLVVTARILRRYSSDEMTLAQMKSRIASGDIDVAFRTDELRKLAPAQFK